MIIAEVAVYPLKTDDATEVINRSIDTLKGTKVEFSVNSMNTKIKGTDTDVFNSLQAMYQVAENVGGEVNMVITISNAT